MRSKLVIAIAAVLVMAGLSVLVVSGSSHREAPLISQDPAVDATDVYAWVDQNDPSMVNLVVNYYPVQEPNGGPNFYRFADDAIYEVHIDNDGDAAEDITYRFDFTTHVMNPNTFLYNTGPITSLDDENWNIRQTYSVSRITGRGASGSHVLGEALMTPPVNIGPSSTPDYASLAAAGVHQLDGGIKVFAGQRDDSFFVDLGAVFDLLTIRELPGNAGGGVDGLGGFNVQTIALQVPIDHITQDDPVIGVWTTSSRPRMRVLPGNGREAVQTGPYTQVSRLGMPLVNELVIPLGEKDRFNASHPMNDAQFLGRVTDPELAKLLNLLYGDVLDDVPETDRQDLVTVFLTGVPGLNQPENVQPSEMLRLNTFIAPSDDPNPLGAIAGDLAGFPNGRRLGDDVVDIELRAAACGYGDILEDLLDLCNLSPNNQLGDGVPENDVEYLDEFPYAGTPHQGFEHEHHNSFPATTAALGIGSSLVLGGIALGAVFTMRRRRGLPAG